MSVRELPVRISPLNHAEVPVPEGTPQAPGEYAKDFGRPSERTVWEVESLISRRSKTVAVSRRESGRRPAGAGSLPPRLVDRIDPYAEIDHNSQFGGSDWRRVSVERHQLTVDARGNVTVRTSEAFSPITFTPNEAYTENQVRVMALLLQFGCLSVSQMCAFMNLPVRSLSYALNRLYAQGLVERMTPGWVKSSRSARPLSGSGDIYRVNLRANTVQDWLSGMSGLEQALLTGGRDVEDLLRNGTFSHKQTLRHNLTVAEVCLRALETGPGVAGVWGEPFVQGDRFVDEVTRSSIDLRSVRGDAAIVTRDGAVIVVEVTGVRDASPTRSEHGGTIAERAAAWAAIAHLSDVPMSVVFVSIGGYAAARRIERRLREDLDEQLSRYFVYAADKERAAKAVHLTSIQAWWPSAGAVSRKFITLEAFSPTERVYRELAPADAPWDPTRPVVVNTVGALHTPEWATRNVKELT